MKRALLGLVAITAATAAFTTSAAPYEDYRMQIQRFQEAKLHGSPSTPALGGMQEHMAAMQQMNRQLEEARSVDRMSAEQMRDWITQHVRLMDQMHREMMGDQAPAMGGHDMHSRPGR